MNHPLFRKEAETAQMQYNFHINRHILEPSTLADTSKTTVNFQRCLTALLFTLLHSSIRWKPHTSDAHVFDFQIRLEVIVTRFHVVEVVVQDTDAACSSAGTVHVKNWQYVNWTSHVAKVLLDAPTDVHPTVSSVRHQDYFVSVALDSQVFRLAERLFDTRCCFDVCSTISKKLFCGNW